MRIVNLPLLGALTAPELTGISDFMTIYGMASIRQLSMPKLQWVRGSVSFGITDDFAVLPRDGVAFAFPMLDINQATSLSVDAVGFDSFTTDKAALWQEFKGHFGAA